MGNKQHTNFESFSKGNKDGLGLKELNKFATEQKESSISLLVFFIFDSGKKGFINQKDFVELEKFLVKFQKKVAEREPTSSPKAQTGASKTASQSSSEKNDAELNPGSPTVAVDGVFADHRKSAHLGSSSSRSSSNCSVSMFQSSFFLKKTFQDKVDEEISQALSGQISDIFSEKGKKDFIIWLCNLVNIEDGHVSTSALQQLVDLTQHDGIYIDCLFYGDNIKENFVDYILKEYGHSQSGLGLAEKDFIQFADNLFSLYERSHVERREISKVNDWYIDHQLGKGGHGVVKCVVNLQTHEKRALKIVKVSSNVGEMSKVDLEIQAMTLLNHPNIVHLYDVVEGESEIYLFMELCGGGSMLDYTRDIPLPEPICRFYFEKLLDGLDYIHKTNICHRDLRLENILLDNKGVLKITDFGQSKVFNPGWDLHQTQFVGSMYHLSPEQLQGKIYSGEKVDIWSAGICLYNMLTASFPFFSSNIEEMMACISEAKYEYPQESKVSEEAKQLLSSLIQVDPEARPTIDEIRQYKWMQMTKEEPILKNFLKTFHDVEKIDLYYGMVGSLMKEFKVHSNAFMTGTLKKIDCVNLSSKTENRNFFGLKYTININWMEDQKELQIEFVFRNGELSCFRKFLKKVEKFMDHTIQ